MHKPSFFVLPLILLSFSHTSCQVRKPSTCDVVNSTYMHRYGVALDKNEWTARGKYGRVISTRKDGVTVCNSYEAGTLHGETTYSFPYRDIMQQKEVYDQGTLLEKWSYYANGLPQKRIVYEPNDQHTVVIWYENGVPQARESYEQNLLVEATYYNPAHQEESCIHHATGIRICRSGKGELISKDEIENGQLKQSTTFYANLVPKAVTPYVNGTIEGIRQTFTEDGLPDTIEEWSQDMQHGNTTVFEHGEKIMDTPYQYGCKQGLEKRYLNGQQIIQEVNWIKGQKHGPCYHYTPDGKLTDWYFKDQLVSKARYDMLCNQ